MKIHWSKPSGLLKNSKTLALAQMLTHQNPTSVSKAKATPAQAGSPTQLSSDRYRTINSDQLWRDTSRSLGSAKRSWLLALCSLDDVLDLINTFLLWSAMRLTNVRKKLLRYVKRQLDASRDV